MRIWIDGDACPVLVKELVFKTSEKRGVPVTLVANSPMYIPRSQLISIVVVDKKFDEADKHIVDSSVKGDLVITADIPLASILIDKQVLAMNPRGKIYTPENVKEELSMRNLREELRSGGLIQGGPPPFGGSSGAFSPRCGEVCSFCSSPLARSERGAAKKWA
jgi:uncharacterized protein YaiI (UPF0178 family)